MKKQCVSPPGHGTTSVPSLQTPPHNYASLGLLTVSPKEIFMELHEKQRDADNREDELKQRRMVYEQKMIEMEQTLQALVKDENDLKIEKETISTRIETFSNETMPKICSAILLQKHCSDAAVELLGVLDMFDKKDWTIPENATSPDNGTL